MAIVKRLVEYHVGEETFEGLLAHDDALEGRQPSVLVCHAWAGRAENEEAAAVHLATKGYVAMAGDVYGKGVRGSSTEENQKLMTPLMEDRSLLHERLSAALTALTSQAEASPERCAVTGFCFGGLCALDMARANMSIKGAAAFHSLLHSWDGAPEGTIEPKVLALQGYDDPMADHEAQAGFAKEMTARNADWQLHLFGGTAHAFTNQKANDPDMGLVYNGVAAARAWKMAEDFVAEATGG